MNMSKSDRRHTYPRECPHCQQETSVRLLRSWTFPVAWFNEHYTIVRSGEIFRCWECGKLTEAANTYVAQNRDSGHYHQYDAAKDD